MQHFTSIEDVEDPYGLMALALQIKQDPLVFSHIGQGKTMGLFFFNPSLRTRLSTQRAAMNLGMQVMTMNLNGESWTLEFGDGTIMDQGSQEHIKEAAAVISSYCDLIGIRTFPGLKNQEEDYKETILQKFIAYSSVPVISLESATLHPLQSLADWITIEEYKQSPRPKVVLTWAPHPKALPQAVPNSFVEWMSRSDVDLVVTHPHGFELSPAFSNGVSINYNQDEALAGADFVYAKNWSSYTNYGQIGREFADWQITSTKMALTNQAGFMHCLPVRRNVVVSDEVLDSPQSLVIPQSENRIFSAQSVILQLLQNESKT